MGTRSPPRLPGSCCLMVNSAWWSSSAVSGTSSPTASSQSFLTQNPWLPMVSRGDGMAYWTPPTCPYESTWSPSHAASSWPCCSRRSSTGRTPPSWTNLKMSGQEYVKLRSGASPAAIQRVRPLSSSPRGSTFHWKSMLFGSAKFSRMYWVIGPSVSELPSMLPRSNSSTVSVVRSPAAPSAAPSANSGSPARARTADTASIFVLIVSFFSSLGNARAHRTPPRGGVNRLLLVCGEDSRRD